MAQVGIPRFYINVLEWLASRGSITLPSNSFRTLPVIPVQQTVDMDIEAKGMTDKSFIALLGHNMASTGNLFKLFNDNGFEYALSGVVNGEGALNGGGYDGFSILTFSGDNDIAEFQIQHTQSSIGSIVLGTYYDLPHSPDLNLTLTREYGGIKTIETKGGSSLSNDFGSSAPAWGDLGAWELSDTPLTPLAKSGRRVWGLSFSYLQDSDVFPEHSNLSDYGTAGSANPFTDGTILHSDDLFSQVIHKTQGLPFIFNPAGGGTNPNNDPDMFAICKFDMKSFKFDQVANSVYNVKLKIREVW